MCTRRYADLGTELLGNNWASIRILLAVAKIDGLPSRSIDFVLAFPKADLEVPV